MTNLSLLIILELMASPVYGQVNKLEKQTVELGSSKYNTTRALDDYAGALSQGFLEYLSGLKEGDTWIDSGAGDAYALINYLDKGGTAQAVAIDARPSTDPVTLRALDTYKDHFKFLSGKYIEKYKSKNLSPAQLITDVVGAVAYSAKLDKVMSVLLKSLAIGGRLYIEVDDYTGVNTAGSGRLKIMKNINGSRLFVPLTDWFKAIKGVNFVLNRSGDGGHDSSFFIRTSKKIKIPKLKLLNYVQDTPPDKIYLWIGR